MRLRVGAFPTIEKAQKFGERFQQEEGFDFVVTKADVLIDPYKGHSEIITTPSTIWMRTGSLNQELYIITKDCAEESKILGMIKPIITRDEEQLKFRHLDQGHTLYIRNTRDEKDSAPSQDRRQSDDIKMLLIDPHPFGWTYQQIKEKYPTVGPDRSMGHGLSHAILKIQACGRDGGIRFNFKNDKLYGLYYEAYRMEASEADALYQKLQAFYADRFGTSIENDYDDQQHHAVLRSSVWSTSKVKFSLHRRVAFKKDGSLTWGP